MDTLGELVQLSVLVPEMCPTPELFDDMNGRLPVVSYLRME